MDNDNGQVNNGQSSEPETTPQGNVAEDRGVEDIKDNPAYIAMKEMLDNQTVELEKLQKQVKDLQVEKEKMALSYGLEDHRQEELDNAWLSFSRYSNDKNKNKEMM